MADLDLNLLLFFNFPESARGSALECVACLDVLVAKKKIDRDVVRRGKDQLYQIVSMLIGLIRANSERHMWRKRLGSRSRFLDKAVTAR